MKNTITTILTLLIFSSLEAQFEFEPGYFIDKGGIQTECLIKNMFWKHNPSQFEYRLETASDVRIGDQQNIQEFGIEGKVKFVKSKVIIDISRDKSKEGNHDNPFTYKEEELFLKVLEEGITILYEYKTNGFQSFFIEANNSPVEELTFNSYVRTEKLKNTKLGYTRKYKLQLYEKLICETITLKDLYNLRYNRNRLINLVRKYNYCKSNTSISYKNPKNKSQLNVKARFGIGLASFSGVFEFGRKLESFNNQLSFRLGTEVEYITTLLDGSVSFTIEPGFLQFSKGRQDLLNKGSGKINFSAIQLPVGLRYNYKLSKKSRIYITALYEFEFPTSSVIKYDDLVIVEIDDEISNELFMQYSIGMGIMIKNLNFELRYHPDKSAKTNSVLDVNYRVVDLIMGYQF